MSFISRFDPLNAAVHVLSLQLLADGGSEETGSTQAEVTKRGCRNTGIFSIYYVFYLLVLPVASEICRFSVELDPVVWSVGFSV